MHLKCIVIPLGHPDHYTLKSTEHTHTTPSHTHSILLQAGEGERERGIRQGRGEGDGGEQGGRDDGGVWDQAVALIGPVAVGLSTLQAWAQTQTPQPSSHLHTNPGLQAPGLIPAQSKPQAPPHILQEPIPSPRQSHTQCWPTQP